MKEIFLLVAVALSVSLLASLAFYFKQKSDDFAERNETLLIYLWECREKANAWDKLFEMVKGDSDSVNVAYDRNLITFQRSGEGYWVLLTHTSEWLLDPIVGSTPAEAFMKYLRRGRP